ncbi:MAG: hypothetical protein KDA81_19860, partial [Planctomycetaceae bacterium]|nr:hypothetical protein [Planctomycetaceae bacterium]
SPTASLSATAEDAFSVVASNTGLCHGSISEITMDCSRLFSWMAAFGHHIGICDPPALAEIVLSR